MLRNLKGMVRGARDQFLELRSIKAKLAAAEDKIFQLRKNFFSCSNLSDNDVLWYTGVTKAIFQLFGQAN